MHILVSKSSKKTANISTINSIDSITKMSSFSPEKVIRERTVSKKLKKE